LHTSLSAISSAALLITALSSPGLAQSSSAAPATGAGPIAWSIVKKGKDFDRNPAAYSVGQLPDGQLVVVGAIGDEMGQPTGAAWVSADGSRWTRLKVKAPKGSAITALGTVGETVVATGVAGDGSGLVWTSADGSAWSPATALDGAIYSLVPTATGLVGVGVEGTAPTAWSTADGLSWQATPLAESGRALHVVSGPDGSLVATGVVTDADDAATPVVWTSTDGATWVETVLGGLLPGMWSVPAAASTPAGYAVTLSEFGESGSIGHVWTSPDGLAWTETRVDEDGSLSAAGSAGIDAMLIGHGQVLRSSDGVGWTATAEAAFEGWTVRDVMTLADGRLFAAGDAFIGQTGSAMATWIGVG
jgi:hypothetical protein